MFSTKFLTLPQFFFSFYVDLLIRFCFEEVVIKKLLLLINLITLGFTQSYSQHYKSNLNLQTSCCEIARNKVGTKMFVWILDLANFDFSIL